MTVSYVLMTTSLAIGRGFGLGDGWSDFWQDVNSSVIDSYEGIALATAVAAGIASLVLLHRHDRRLSARSLLFGAFAVWGIPPALGGLLVSRDVDTPTFWAHLVQVDVAITVLVASLLLVCRLDRHGRHRSAQVAVRSLASALICSTVLVHLTLTPSVWAGGWWHVLIVAPVVWTMIAGGKRGKRNVGEMLWLVGSWTVFLATAAYAAMFGTFDHVSKVEELAVLWFAVPLAVTASFVATGEEQRAGVAAAPRA